MCSNNNNACCPPDQVFQESHCGNFKGNQDDDRITVWESRLDCNDFIQGTFEVFNSNDSKHRVKATVVKEGYGDEEFYIYPGDSVLISVSHPKKFKIKVQECDHGKFCFNLFKRILA